GRIDDDVVRFVGGGVVPRSEHADFRLPLRIDGAFQKSDPWMPTARVRQHEQSVLFGKRYAAGDLKSLQRSLDLLLRQSGCRRDLVGGVAVTADHVDQPMP